MSATFTLTGKLLHHDHVTPHVSAEVDLVAVVYADATDHVVYTQGATAVTDANGAFSLTLLTEPGLFYTVKSVSVPPLFDPVTFPAPASGTTTDLASLVTTAPGAVTPSVLTDTLAARDAAISAASAAAASASVFLWQPTTAYTAGQTTQAPDGSQIKSNSSRTSRASFDATEQANWTVVFAVPGTLARAALDVQVEGWGRGLRVDDLSFPIVIAHRGAANREAENTVAAYRGAAAALGFQAIEAGDVRALSDGTLVTCHDTTVDAAMTGTGNVNSFTKATWQAMSVDVAAGWGGTYVNQPAPLWDDALAALAGKVVIFPEVKDTLDSTATAMCDRLDALGARDSAVICSFALSNLVIAVGRGYKTMWVGTTAASAISILATLKTDNIWSVCLDYTQADVTAANIATIQAAGFRVFLYTVDHRANASSAQVLAADGFYSNSGRDYIVGNTSAYRKTSTSYHLSGRFEQGMVTSADGPYNANSRGSLIGSPGAYRLKVGSIATGGIVFGSICPVANAAGSYTITVGIAIDTIPTTTSDGPSIYFALPDDSLTGGSNRWSSYQFKVRASGAMQLWAIGNTGTVTSLGTATATAFQNLTLTSALTGGTATTTLAVSALTVALKVGHQFMLPNGQIVTVATAAAIGATSVTIQSVTPASTVASGSVLIPYVVMLITVSPTTVTAQRGDETSVAAISAADTSWRGGWISTSKTSDWATGAVSFHKVTVS